MSVYYYFKAELPSEFDCRKAKTVAAGQRWDLACYQIEKRLGIHNKMRQQKANANHTHIVAVHHQDWLTSGRDTPVPDDYQLLDGDRLVLFRVALPPNVAPPLPLAIRRQEQEQEQQLRRAEQDARWQPMTEEERLQELLQGDGRRHTFEGVCSGGSRGESRGATGPPPAGYICHRCGKGGHFKSQCPTLKDPNFTPLDRRRRTTGVPLSELRPARPDELAWAWLHSDGRLMVPRV
jgi:hypothetical protein